MREAARLLQTHDVEKEFELGLESKLAGLDVHRAGRRATKRGIF